MSNPWATDGGIYLGFGTDWTEGVPPSLSSPLCYVGDRHIVTIGPNGSGKSRRTLLPNLYRLKNWSMLVVDPKGEFAAETAEARRQAGNNVIVLNPFNVRDLGSDGFNPVAALDPESDDFPDDALGLAEALIKVEGKEPHWSQSAQDLISALIMYSRLTSTSVEGVPPGSLRHVRRILGLKKSEFGTIINEAINLGFDTDCEELAVKAGRFSEIDSENRELNSIISTSLTQTRWLDSRPVKVDLEGGTYDFREMKNHPTVVYLILPARRLGTHATWLRLIITSILQALMKDTGAPKCPTLLMLDEFAQLGHLPIIENTVAMMRGYGVKLWSVFQDLSQAQAIYDKRWETFMSNAGILHSYAPQDITTAEYLSKHTGQTAKSVLNWSQQSQAGTQTAGGNVSVSKMPAPLMLPQDLRNMDMGYFVLFSHKIKGTIKGYCPDPDDPLGRQVLPRMI